MSKMIAVKNDSDTPKTVAGRTVAPGETRHFPEHEVPAYLREVEQLETVEVANPLKALLDNPIKDVIPTLQALSDDHLSELELIEIAGDDRSGISKAIQEERLRRADLSLNDDENGKEKSGVQTYIDGQNPDVTE